MGGGEITKRKALSRAGLIVMIAVSLFVCPLATGLTTGPSSAGDMRQFGTVRPQAATFTVPVPGETPQATLLGRLETPSPETTDGASSGATKPIISLGSIVIRSRPYAVGDEFSDASGIRLSGVHSDTLENYGYATIFDDTDYRLLWYTDRSGAKHYMILHKDDDLYRGENGFKELFDDYTAAAFKMHASVGVALSGSATLMGLGLAGCVPSAGVGCIVAGVGAAVTGLGGILAEFYFGIFEVGPATEALVTTFQAADANRGVDYDQPPPP